MNPNIRDQNIAAGFNVLAQALMPNAQGLIEADLARYKRDGLIADTNRTNVDATRLAADRERLLTEARRTQGFIDADRNLAAVLADPGFNPADPAWRARLAAAAVTTQDGLSKGPAGVTGMSTFIQPDFAGSPDAFANILMGTGVVPNYANTQPGFQANEAGEMARNAADNTRALDVARIQAQGEMDRLAYATTTPLAPGAKGAGGGSTTPLTVQPGTAEKMAEILAGRIEQLYPGAIVDPAQMQQMVTDASTLFQQTRNADAAIAQVLSGLTTTTQDESWLPTGDTTRGQYVSPMGAAPAAPAAAPSATVPPATATGAPAVTAPPPQAITAVDAQGRRIMFDPASNQWVPVGPVRQ